MRDEIPLGRLTIAESPAVREPARAAGGARVEREERARARVRPVHRCGDRWNGINLNGNRRNGGLARRIRDRARRRFRSRRGVRMGHRRLGTRRVVAEPPEERVRRSSIRGTATEGDGQAHVRGGRQRGSGRLDRGWGRQDRDRHGVRCRTARRVVDRHDGGILGLCRIGVLDGRSLGRRIVAEAPVEGEVARASRRRRAKGQQVPWLRGGMVDRSNHGRDRINLDRCRIAHGIASAVGDRARGGLLSG